MPSQWYTSQITGNPIYSAGIPDGNSNQIRHFMDMPVIPGAFTKCGLQISDGDDTNITDTCMVCSLAACGEKIMPSDLVTDGSPS